METVDWGRWDVGGHRTIYAASSQAGAYIETLSWAQKKHTSKVSLSDFFDHEEIPEQDLMDAIDQDFRQNNWMAWGQIPREWRTQRSLYALTLPQTGWFVDIDNSSAITTLNRKLPKLLGGLGVSALNLSHVYSSDRELTTGIARWVWGRTLFDGTAPHGIRYHSKFGVDHLCYATWLRCLDSGGEAGSEPTKQIGTQEIVATDPALRTAASHLNLHVH